MKRRRIHRLLAVVAGRMLRAWFGSPRGLVEAPQPPTRSGEEGAPDADPVERLPVLLNRGALGRRLSRSYPRRLVRAGVEGTVTVRFVILENGRVAWWSRAIVESCHPRLNAPTLAAVRILRFAPARVDGAAVRVWVELPIHWHVHR